MAMFHTHTALFNDSSSLVDLSPTMISPPPSLNSEAPTVTWPVPKPKQRRKTSTDLQGSEGEGSITKDTSRILACLSCRQKKIKCHRKSSTCNRCERLQIPCVIPDEDERLRPSSKKRTRELERQIESLQKQLRESEERAQRNLYLTPPMSTQSQSSHAGMDLALGGSDLGSDLVDTATVADFDKTPQTLIGRLCAENAHIHEDESGRVRYYGPTSILHTSEKPPSYDYLKWNIGPFEPDDQDDISPTLRDHLLEQYWRFQHSVLQVVHREAFLQDMQAGRTRYYSKGLLYAILANAAVFSEVPEIRALALSRDEDLEGAKPYLLRKATEMVEQEIESNVGITTVQGLQLLSAVQSRRGADTKGWLESGRSSRLIFELGLHKDEVEFASNRLSPMDLEVRQVVFWGSFAYDRGWGLYLGRPCALNLDDVTISPPALLPNENSSYSAELLLLRAWATLFSVVGEISNTFNKKSFTHYHLQTLRQKLLNWESSLDPSLRHSSGCSPGVYVLHFQFHGAMILLHRSTAKFGTYQTESTPISQEARAICVDHGLQIARILADYRVAYGSALTLVGVAMYNITTAAVVLIAILSEPSTPASNEYLSSLTTCIAALEEIQHSHMGAKTVLKQLRYLMRRCKLLNIKEDSQILRDANASFLQRRPTNTIEAGSPPVKLLGQIVQPDRSSSDDASAIDPGQFILALEDCDALMNMVSWNDFSNVFV
ncbi:hypothetical protein A1O3_01013 [Capronia epimyces CBS 606.96]|uniref:Zn(2)-C6 fungal-type domain-containing protein n=1 Tax=Capronia epimyces CBS 606.96 TaxID=1182542 RepID=W9YHV5_9EURO|nr:uncharacterized protein A1O3_01013 [Capronia epimyces CBS 606.96]EXJ92462.1 hypothetical protein A1O3_01013 [Capronia epimyces CBS 606.96]